MSAARMGQAAAARLFIDRIVVRRKTGESVDENTWQTVPVYETVYTGPAKLQTYEGYEVEREAAGQKVIEFRATVHVPVGSFESLPGDIVTFTTAWDQILVGRNMRITQTYPAKSLATAYRIFTDTNIFEQVPPLEVTP